MTHNDKTIEMLYWHKNKDWYGFDPEKGFYLKPAAPPEAQNSFRKWAAHQDELGDEGYDYSLDIA